MNLLHSLLLSVSNIGFFIAWTALLAGIFISFIIANAGNKFKGTLLGFIGGLLLSVVCFDLIPNAFKKISIGVGVVTMLLGLSFSTLLDGFLNRFVSTTNKDKKQHLYKAAIFMTIGVAIDNIPSGVALGSLLTISTAKGFELALVLLLTGIPEGITIGYFLKESRMNLFTVMLLSILASIPMSLGAGIGASLSKVSPQIMSVSLAFASGLILYVIFRETLKEARETWHGRLSAIGNVLGIISGFLSINLIH